MDGADSVDRRPDIDVCSNLSNAKRYLDNRLGTTNLLIGFIGLWDTQLRLLMRLSKKGIMSSNPR